LGAVLDADGLLFEFNRYFCRNRFTFLPQFRFGPISGREVCSVDGKDKKQLRLEKIRENDNLLNNTKASRANQLMRRQLIFSDKFAKGKFEQSQVEFLTEPISQDWNELRNPFLRRKTMETLRRILYIDTSWKVMYILIRGGVMIKSMLSLETTLSLLKKQNFDLLLADPVNMTILNPQESIKNRVMDFLKVLTS
jgi:hypothetical protein